jgi:hypothetical protein
MKRFKKKKNKVDVEDLKVSTKNKEIAMKFIELEKKAQEDSNFDYATEMEKLITEYNLSIGDMIDIDFYIQNQNEKLFEINILK